MNKELHRKEYYDFFKSFKDPSKLEWYEQREYFKDLVKVAPLRIEMDGDSTTVYWDDGSKTTVTFSSGDDESIKSPYNAFCAAFTKRMFRSNSRIHKMLDEFDAKKMDQEFEEFLDAKEAEEKKKEEEYEKNRAKKLRKESAANRTAVKEKKTDESANLDDLLNAIIQFRHALEKLV